MDDIWGKLTYINDQEKEPILLCKRRFVIGRGQDCDLSLSSKNVSKYHCYLELHDDGQVHLCDTSSNGTLLNKTTKLTQPQSAVLKTGDEFCIVFNKPVRGIGFLFSNLKETEESISGDETQEYSLLPDADLEPENGAAFKSGTEGEAQTAADETKSDRTSNTNEDTAAQNVKCRNSDSDDEMADLLTCSICQEIIYKCVSLLPCMHCFCSSCYSEWMVLSQECPQCRVKVKSIAPNYSVSGLIDVYLKHHPDKQRDKDELKELDSKNRITREMLYPRDGGLSHPESGSGDNSAEEDDSDSSADNELALIPHLARRRRTMWHHFKICRQCPDQPPEKRQKNGYEAEAKADVAGSSVQPVARQPIYVCGPTTTHVTCRCCFKHVPDRSRDRLLDRTIPPQSCVLCPPGVMFCHMYWGCDRPGCTGCLSTFKDIVLADNCLDFAVSGNPYESTVVLDYLRRQKKTWRDVLRACLEKLDAGEYTVVPATLRYTPQPVVISSASVLCKECAYKCFSQLAYQYRKDIANEELSDEVKAREDCYWGRNCRTQTKYHHAKKFNHICEQTRFK